MVSLFAGLGKMSGTPILVLLPPPSCIPGIGLMGSCCVGDKCRPGAPCAIMVGESSCGNIPELAERVRVVNPVPPEPPLFGEPELGDVDECDGEENAVEGCRCKCA